MFLRIIILLIGFMIWFPSYSITGKPNYTNYSEADHSITFAIKCINEFIDGISDSQIKVLTQFDKDEINISISEINNQEKLNEFTYNTFRTIPILEIKKEHQKNFIQLLDELKQSINTTVYLNKLRELEEAIAPNNYEDVWNNKDRIIWIEKINKK